MAFYEKEMECKAAELHSHCKKVYLLVVDPGGSQCLLKLGEAHDIDVDELNHLVALGGATGLVPHDPAHDPEN